MTVCRYCHRSLPSTFDSDADLCNSELGICRDFATLVHRADYGVSYGTQTQGDGTYEYENKFDEEKNKPDLDGDDYLDNEEISQDDLWVVISSFFDEMGLVQQQLSSFNEFIETTLNDVMEEHGNLALDQISQNTGATYDQSVSLPFKLGYYDPCHLMQKDFPRSVVSISASNKFSWEDRHLSRRTAVATPRHRKKLVFETERAYISVPDWQ